MDKEILSIILILTLFLLFGLIILLNNSKKLDSSIKKRLLADMAHIKIMVNTKNPLISRDIILRMDSLLSKSLQLYYKNNDSCGENLKKAKNIFDKKLYNEIWEIHKLRNKVVHENEEISTSQVLEGYNIINSAIKKLLHG